MKTDMEKLFDQLKGIRAELSDLVHVMDRIANEMAIVNERSYCDEEE